MKILKILVPLVLILVALQIVVVISGQFLRKHYLNQEVDEDSVNVIAVIGSLEESVTSKAFKGGYLRAVMGGVELDLSDAVVAEKPAHLEVTIIMGGVDIRVPPEWNVNIDGVSLKMGGIDGLVSGNDDLSEGVSGPCHRLLRQRVPAGPYASSVPGLQ